MSVVLFDPKARRSGGCIRWMTDKPRGRFEICGATLKTFGHRSVESGREENGASPVIRTRLSSVWTWRKCAGWRGMGQPNVLIRETNFLQEAPTETVLATTLGSIGTQSLLKVMNTTHTRHGLGTEQGRIIRDVKNSRWDFVSDTLYQYLLYEE